MSLGGGSVELGAAEGLAEGPAVRHGGVGDDGAAVASGDAEGEALAVEERVALPVLAPVAGQGLPGRRALRLDGHGVHVAGAAHVGDQDQVEVRVAVDGEPDAALLLARDPVDRVAPLLALVRPTNSERMVRVDLGKGWDGRYLR